MNKQTFMWIAIVLIAVLVVVGILFWVGKNSVQAPIVGGDKDIHGCVGSAGYSWCELKQKCLRVWEEPCAKAEVNFTEEGNLTQKGGVWSVVYEKPGKPALTKILSFDNLSECFLSCDKTICDTSKLTTGERVRIGGNLGKDDKVLVSNMVYVNKQICDGDKQ